MFSRRPSAKDRPRSRALLWIGLAGLLFGSIALGQPLEDLLRTARNTLHEDKASGDIVLVAIDERSLRELHNWPWPRRYHARMVNEISRLGAKRVFFDVIFSFPSTPFDDHALAAALAKSRARVTLPVTPAIDEAGEQVSALVPLQAFRTHADLSTIVLEPDHRNAVWRLPHAWSIVGREFPSFSSALAGHSVPRTNGYPVDYSISAVTIPRVSAVDLVNGKVSPRMLAGKDVVIGTTSTLLDDNFLVPGRGRMGGAYVHILGAETLKRGNPIHLGWLPGFLFAWTTAFVALRSRRVVHGSMYLVASGATLLLAPVLLESMLIFVDTVPALFVVVVTACALSWSRLRQKATLNAVSGLPNLTSLRQDKSLHTRPLIAARIQNYAEIASTLPPGQEKALVGQIAARLTLGSSDPRLYHGDDGLFVWFLNQGHDAIGAHLDALSALFRSPLVIAGAHLDLAVSFGVDVDDHRSSANRLGSALVAADEAAKEGRKWKHYDPAKLKNAAWKLSLLSRLDAAIDAKELWVALQPQLDLKTGRLCGAEALVRWTHPTRGVLAPSEFIPPAEQSGRIDGLTDFVLQEGIVFAAAMREQGVPFPVAVNLSARSLDRADLSQRVSDLLARYALPASCLTLEITETSALASDVNLVSLEQLRQAGVRISIDDYGTGQSTLEYLKRIPANEIKIDQSFVQAIGASRSDRLLVHSTIQLAHSLGQVVVAEGVEDEPTLAALREMGCDVAQGFYIARPMDAGALARELLARKQRVA